MAVKFISYNGSYPNLCSGVLEIEVDGKVYEIKNGLRSGGNVWFDSEGIEQIEEGEWVLDKSRFPAELTPYLAEIDHLVNFNVEYGCCGGCV